MLGATIFNTVGSVEKRDHLIRKHTVPAEKIFYSHDISFVEDIIQHTGGKGVDVVLNSLSGEVLHASWECLAAYGRFVEIGKRDLQNNAKLAMQGFERNCTFTAVDLEAIRADRSLLFDGVFQKVMELSRESTFTAQFA